jgi:hypothetical protein
LNIIKECGNKLLTPQFKQQKVLTLPGKAQPTASCFLTHIPWERDLMSWSKVKAINSQEVTTYSQKCLIVFQNSHQQISTKEIYGLKRVVLPSLHDYENLLQNYSTFYNI